MQLSERPIIAGGLEANGRSIYPREQLRRQGIEIEFGDIEKDAVVLAALISQPQTIEHVTGIAPPDNPGVNVRRFREKNPHLNILIATPEGIKQYYQRPGIHLLVAHNINDDRVVGTATVETPALGITGVTISRLAVDASERRKHIAEELVWGALAFAFQRHLEGGLGMNHARAGVIVGVSGDSAPLSLFRKIGFQQANQLQKTCVGWSNTQGRFVLRDAIPTFLYQPNYVTSLRLNRRTIDADFPIQKVT